MQILWGVIPQLITEYHNADEMFDIALNIAKEDKLVKEGDHIIMTAGTGHAGITNMLRVV